MRLVTPVVGTRVVLSDNGTDRDIDDVVASHQDPWWEAAAAADDHD